MLRTIALLGAIVPSLATTPANAAWIVSGHLVEERISACTFTAANGCNLTASLFPASIAGRLVEFTNVSCQFSINGPLPFARLILRDAQRFQHLQPVLIQAPIGTLSLTYNSQASFTIQATTTKALELQFSSQTSLSIVANCLLVGRLVD